MFYLEPEMRREIFAAFGNEAVKIAEKKGIIWGWKIGVFAPREPVFFAACVTCNRYWMARVSQEDWGMEEKMEFVRDHVLGKAAQECAHIDEATGFRVADARIAKAKSTERYEREREKRSQER